MSVTPTKRLRVALLSGGESQEAGVSRVSAASVLAALEPHYPSLVNIELSASVVTELQQFQPDVVFPVLHGPPGEDGTVQGLLEMLAIPYIGSDVHGSAVAMDKIAAKGLLSNTNVPLAQHGVLSRQTFEPAQLKTLVNALGAHLVVKPVRQGSALGVTRVSDQQALTEAVALAFNYDDQLLIEQRIIGREMTVGILEHPGRTDAFPVIEIITPENSWYDFHHRYTQGASDHIMPAEITPALTAQLQAAAITAHQCLGCRDLSRADFIVMADNTFVLLEVNTLPGMTPTSLYPDGARGQGYAFDELLVHLIERACVRGTSSRH
ncbi:MAG: D-alanine--D-alanine ligase [Pseudomonadales bacterium]|jgi:D-alanine-D-alanine ligase